MWLYTRFGIFSIVKDMETGDFKVRSRWEEHLQLLLQIFPSGEIVTSTDTDYPFRIIVSEQEYWEIMRDLTASIDYGNFKSQVYDDQVLPYIEGTMEAIYGAYESCEEAGRTVRPFTPKQKLLMESRALVSF